MCITLAGVWCLLIVLPSSSHAQNTCKGYVFGIPVCTGFCLETDSSSSQKWLDDLKQMMDSVHNVAVHFEDSLVKKFKPFDLRRKADSLLGKLPKEMQKWKFEIPKNLEMPEHPALPKAPSQEKERNPVKDFPGWYWKQVV